MVDNTFFLTAIAVAPASKLVLYKAGLFVDWDPLPVRPEFAECTVGSVPATNGALRTVSVRAAISKEFALDKYEDEELILRLRDQDGNEYFYNKYGHYFYMQFTDPISGSQESGSFNSVAFEMQIPANQAMNTGIIT